ncbi:beta-ketoacyl synthase N-terminal-like domain-containing protein [Streptomyces sp. NPDC007205]|uniref:beta-ketoacyl synthase N-terminal-like domain-containing protein n=1 Tax=Streptomyces sp. NPDC007205 TaxID=3154316 RepID=UPI0033DE98A4
MPAFAVDPRLSPDVPHHLRRRIDRFTALGYMAVAGALSGVPIAQQPDRDRIGVFMANTRSGWSYAEPELIRLIHSGVDAMRAYLATAWFPAALQGETTIGLDLRGCAKTASGRVSGFGEALWLARDALERHAVDLAIVGAAESLVSPFVLHDWPPDEPLPSRGMAEGAVMFAIRRPSGQNRILLTDLRYTRQPPQQEPDWVPTLSGAGRLRMAVDTAVGEDTNVALGGGYWITVNYPKEDS